MQLIQHPFRWCGVPFWGAKHPVEVLMPYVSCESLWTDLRWRTSRDWRRTILKRCQSKWWKVWRLEVVLGPYTFLPQDSKIWQSILKISLNYPSAIMILHPSHPTLWSNIFSNHANIFQPTRMDQSDFVQALRILRRFLEQGSEVLCAAGALDPAATVSVVAMQVGLEGWGSCWIGGLEPSVKRYRDILIFG